MQGFFLHASLLAIIYGLSSSKQLLASGSRISFSAILLLIGVEAGYGWLYDSEIIFRFPHLIRLNAPLVFLIGPAFYFYLRFYQDPKRKFASIDMLHLSPAILCLVYFSPFYLGSAQDKLIYMRDTMINQGLESYVLGTIRRTHQLVYLALIFGNLTRSKRKGFNENSYQPIILMSGFALIWVFDMYRLLFDFTWSIGIYDSWLLSGFVLILLFYELQFRPKRTRKYQTSGLKQSTGYGQEIVDVLVSEKAFLNPKLKLADLAQILHVNQHYLSQIINQDLKTNYNDLINSYRIKEAQNLLLDHQYDHFTLEAIAEKAGFNSTSTFNSAFKKATGMTPGAFKSISPK